MERENETEDVVLNVPYEILKTTYEKGIEFQVGRIVILLRQRPPDALGIIYELKGYRNTVLFFQGELKRLPT